MKKIHLIRTREVDTEVYDAIVQYLKQFSGPMTFFGYDESFEISGNAVRVIQKTDEDFEDMEMPVMEMTSHYLISDELRIELNPPKVDLFEWDDLFRVARKFRKEKRVADSELVFVLTYKGNENNWFVGSAPKGVKDFFVHLLYWDHYIMSEPTFPVAYHVAATVLKNDVWGSIEQYLPDTHDHPIGCMSDMCQYKPDVIYKLRTADICTDCKNKMIASGVDRTLFLQVLRIFDSVRSQLLFRERFKILNELPQMLLYPAQLKLVFPDLKGLSISLRPVQFAVYWFFINRPQGILLSHVNDYFDEILALYRQCSPQTDPDTQKAVVKALCNLQDQSLSQNMSKIKKLIKQNLGEEIGKPYMILGPNGEIKSIAISRERVQVILPNNAP